MAKDSRQWHLNRLFQVCDVLRTSGPSIVPFLPPNCKAGHAWLKRAFYSLFCQHHKTGSWSTSATWAVIGFSNIANSKKGPRRPQSFSINFAHPLCFGFLGSSPSIHRIRPVDSNVWCHNHLARSLEGQIRWLRTARSGACHPPLLFDDFGVILPNVLAMI